MSMSDLTPPPYSLLTDGIKPVVSSAPETAASLVSQPKLILERKTYARGPHYVIGSPQGTVLAFVEPEWQISPPTMVEFHYGVFNTNKEKLLSIDRNSPFFSKSLQTHVTVHGSGNNEPVGVCKGSDRACRRQYALSLSSEKAPFCRAAAPRALSHAVVLVNNSGNEAGRVCWNEHEKRGEKSTSHMSYELYMSPALSIQERALLLATAINVDFDYFTSDTKFTNPYTQGKVFHHNAKYGGLEVD